MITSDGATPTIHLSTEQLTELERCIAPQLLLIRQLEGQLALVRQGLVISLNAFTLGAGCTPNTLDVDLQTGKVTELMA